MSEAVGVQAVQTDVVAAEQAGVVIQLDEESADGLQGVGDEGWPRLRQ